MNFLFVIATTIFVFPFLSSFVLADFNLDCPAGKACWPKCCPDKTVFNMEGNTCVLVSQLDASLRQLESSNRVLLFDMKINQQTAIPVLTEVRDTEHTLTESRDTPNLLTEARDAENLKTEVRDNKNLLTESRDTPNLLTEARDAENLLTESRDTQNLLTEARDAENLKTEARDAENLKTEARDAENLLYPIDNFIMQNLGNHCKGNLNYKSTKYEFKLLTGNRLYVDTRSTSGVEIYAQPFCFDMFVNQSSNFLGQSAFLCLPSQPDLLLKSPTFDSQVPCNDFFQQKVIRILI